MATPDELFALFQPLYADIKQEQQFNVTKPLLAHYTSMQALESIIRNDELWFSNPLLMNDLEELRFGVLTGVQAARESSSLRTAFGLAACVRHSGMKRVMSAFESRWIITSKNSKRITYSTHMFFVLPSTTATTTMACSRCGEATVAAVTESQSCLIAKTQHSFATDAISFSEGGIR
jgi:hypothetical protein